MDLSLLKQFINNYDIIVSYNSISRWSAKFNNVDQNYYCKFYLIDEQFTYLFTDITIYHSGYNLYNNVFQTNGSFVINNDFFKGAINNGRYLIGCHMWDSSTSPPTAQNNHTEIHFRYDLIKKGLIQEFL